MLRRHLSVVHVSNCSTTQCLRTHAQILLFIIRPIERAYCYVSTEQLNECMDEALD